MRVALVSRNPVPPTGLPAEAMEGRRAVKSSIMDLLFGSTIACGKRVGQVKYLTESAFMELIDIGKLRGGITCSRVLQIPLSDIDRKKRQNINILFVLTHISKTSHYEEAAVG